MAKSIQLVTKSQLQILYSAWGVVADIPTAKEATVIAWPHPANPSRARITLTKKPATYGGRLFLIEYDFDLPASL